MPASQGGQGGGEAEDGEARGIGRGGTEEGERTCHEPRLIMGSMVKMWPGLTMPLACIMASGETQIGIEGLKLEFKLGSSGLKLDACLLPLSQAASLSSGFDSNPFLCPSRPPPYLVLRVMGYVGVGMKELAYSMAAVRLDHRAALRGRHLGGGGERETKEGEEKGNMSRCFWRV